MTVGALVGLGILLALAWVLKPDGRGPGDGPDGPDGEPGDPTP